MGLLVLLLWGIPSFSCFLSPLDSLPVRCYLPAVCVFWSLPHWSSLFSCCCLTFYSCHGFWTLPFLVHSHQRCLAVYTGSRYWRDLYHQRDCLCDCSSFSSGAFAPIVVFPLHVFLLLLVCPLVSVRIAAKLESIGWAVNAGDQSCCVTALLPLGHWLAVLFTWAFEFLWACLTLHELHGCFAFAFSHLMLIEVEQPISCSSALIYVSVPVTTWLHYLLVSNPVIPTVDASPR